MELSWGDAEISLSLFLDRFKPPQVIQIAEGEYGNDEETTLSRGQELNLHLLKDMRLFSGLTELGEEIHIPFNSPHKVSVFSESLLKKDAELVTLFPKKYPYIRCSTRRQNLSDPTEIIEGGDMIKTLYFDKDTQTVICLDKTGCELSFGLDMFEPGGGLIPLEKIDGVFMVEVGQRFSLPLTVQFMPQSNSSVRLERGFIHLKQEVVKQTVIATTRDTDCKAILTFPSTLDVTVLAPKEAAGANPAYLDLCKHINSKVNLKKVEEAVEKNEQIYDDVKAALVKAIPYAESFFGSRVGRVQRKNDDDSDLDGDGYMVMDASMFRGNDDDNDSSSSSDPYDEPADFPTLKPPPQRPERPAHVTSPTFKPLLQTPGISVPVTSPDNTKGRPRGSFLQRLTLRKNKKQNSSGSISPRSPPSASSTSPDVFKSPSSSTGSPFSIDALKSPKSPKPLTSSSSCSDVFPSVSPHTYGLNEDYEDIYGDDDENYEIPTRPTGKSGGSIDRANCYSSSKRRLVVEPDKKTENLTVQEIGMLLHDLNLGQYGEMFEKEQVDGKILMELEKEVLQSHFSMTSFHAHKLMKAAMENWRPTVSD